MQTLIMNSSHLFLIVICFMGGSPTVYNMTLEPDSTPLSAPENTPNLSTNDDQMNNNTIAADPSIAGPNSAGVAHPQNPFKPQLNPVSTNDTTVVRDEIRSQSNGESKPDSEPSNLKKVLQINVSSPQGQYMEVVAPSFICKMLGCKIQGPTNRVGTDGNNKLNVYVCGGCGSSFMNSNMECPSLATPSLVLDSSNKPVNISAQKVPNSMVFQQMVTFSKNHKMENLNQCSLTREDIAAEWNQFTRETLSLQSNKKLTLNHHIILKNSNDAKISVAIAIETNMELLFSREEKVPVYAKYDTLNTFELTNWSKDQVVVLESMNTITNPSAKVYPGNYIAASIGCKGKQACPIDSISYCYAHSCVKKHITPALSALERLKMYITWNSYRD